jgi:hypothetical protein
LDLREAVTLETQTLTNEDQDELDNSVNAIR